MNVTEILEDNVEFQDSLRFFIKRIHEHRVNEPLASYEFLVEWRGFSMQDNSWEPLETIFTDAPKALKTYARGLPNTDRNWELKDYIDNLF